MSAAQTLARPDREGMGVSGVGMKDARLDLERELRNRERGSPIEFTFEFKRRDIAIELCQSLAQGTARGCEGRLANAACGEAFDEQRDLVLTAAPDAAVVEVDD